VQPLYRHPCLVDKRLQATDVLYANPDDGSITDGDDHFWLGDTATLRDFNKWTDFGDLNTMLDRKRSRSASTSSVLGVEALLTKKTRYDDVSDNEDEVCATLFSHFGLARNIDMTT
jgi:hypothetical protein